MFSSGRLAKFRITTWAFPCGARVKSNRGKVVLNFAEIASDSALKRTRIFALGYVNVYNKPFVPLKNRHSLRNNVNILCI